MDFKNTQIINMKETNISFIKSGDKDLTVMYIERSDIKEDVDILIISEKIEVSNSEKFYISYQDFNKHMKVLEGTTYLIFKKYEDVDVIIPNVTKAYDRYNKIKHLI